MSCLYFLFCLPWIKLRVSWLKYIILASPIVVLVAAIAALNTLSTSIDHIIDKKILPIVENQERLITLNDSLGEQGENVMTGRQSPSYKYFKHSEIEDLKHISHVESVVIGHQAPGLSATTINLIDNKNIVIDRFATMEAALATRLGAKEFTYQEGQAIPVVLGAEALKTMRVDLHNPEKSDNAQQFLERYPRSSTILETIKDPKQLIPLVDQEFELQLGQLQWQPLLYRQAAELENTYAFIPESTRQQLYQQYKDKINRHWDYQQLTQPLKIRIKVTAIDFTVAPGSISMPEQAAKGLYLQLAQRLHQAQQGKLPIPPTEIGKTYQGLTTVEGHLESSADYYSHLVLPDQSRQLPPIFIPGFHYQAGQQLSTDQVATLPLSIDRITLAADHLDNRVTVHNNAFAMGYQRGISTQNIYLNVKNMTVSLQNMFEFFGPVFLIITVITTFFMTLRVVKSSELDLGIVRMIGATRIHALLMFIGFFTQQLLAAIILGAVVGYTLIVTAAPFIANQILQSDALHFNEIVAIYGQQLTVAVTDFVWLDLSQLASDLALLIVVCLAGLLVSSLLAARTQPSTLVRNNQE